MGTTTRTVDFCFCFGARLKFKYTAKNGVTGGMYLPYRVPVQSTKQLIPSSSLHQMITLPAIETTPVLFLRFTKKATPSLINYVKSRLNEEGIIVFQEEDSENNTLFGLTTKQIDLEHEAERCNLHKPATLIGMDGSLKCFEGTTLMRPFEVANRDCYKRKKDTGDEYADGAAAVAYDAEGLFTSADRVKILFSEIEALSVLKPGTMTSNLVRVLNDTIKVPGDDIATRYRHLYLCDTLRNHGFIDRLAPVHNRHICEKICRVAMDPKSPFPIEALRSYYGEDIGFYFAWLQFYTKFLLFP